MRSMCAVVTKETGGPENLVLQKYPTPKPCADEVLIQVHAIGVNPADIEQRKGEYLPKTEPFVLGLEVAGVVASVGNNVEEYKVGDRVMALLTGGGYADYVLAHNELCLPIPEHLSFAEAAGIPEAAFTVWSTVFYGAKLKGPENLLVHGGTGGIGSFAIQLARCFGVTVITTAGSDEKCKLCKQLGANYAINYVSELIYDRVLEVTKNVGVHVILDSIGGVYLKDHLRLLTRHGRLVLIDCQGNSTTDIDLLPLITKNISISGSVLSPRPLHEKICIAKQIKQHVMPYLYAGAIKPVISKTFPLEMASQAHQFMESKKHIGKIILLNKWDVEHENTC